MKYLSLVLTLFFVTGCSFFTPGAIDVSNNYELNSIPAVPHKHKTSRTLVVGTPDSEPSYNTTQMAYVIKPYEISYYAKNRWAAPPSDMLQNLMVQTLQKTNHFRAVVASPFMGHIDYFLNSRLVRLEQNFLSRPSFVCLSLDVQLVSATSGHVIAAKKFTVKEFAPQSSPYGGVLAANRAAEQLLVQLTQFILRNT